MILPLIQDNEDKNSILKNCIRNNYRHLRKWAKRTNTDCFRIYDRDIKEYPLSIDIYAGKFCVHYFTDERDQDVEIDTSEVDGILNDLFGKSEIHSRSRIRRHKLDQYEKRNDEKNFFVVLEHGVQFLVNLEDYLDTGLFLDHRSMRQFVAKEAKGKKVLNLFAYTASFSVHAAVCGALFTKSVDMSNTYTAWSRKNFELNQIPSKNHQIVREDCMKFLKEENLKYDIIIIDPPTISRSKKMEEMFDVQKDYVELISSSLRLLEKNGVIFFSTNFRKFLFDEHLFPECRIQEISEKTVPEDFHQKKIHRAWKIMNLSFGFISL